MTDKYGRKIEYLRVSVTSACGLSCIYCGGGKSCKNELSAQSVISACKAAAEAGVKKLRFTGGEPLLRPDLCDIILGCSRLSGIEHISLTTNGVLLEKLLPRLISSGLNSVNISLDTTDAQFYRTVTNGGNIQMVLKNIEAAAALLPTRINCVPLSEHYKSQTRELCELSEKTGAVVRFIELMPMGSGAALKGVGSEEIIKHISAIYGEAEISTKPHGYGPAVYYKFKGMKNETGFISPMSHCFCEGCTRLRLSSDGRLRPCLASSDEIDISKALQSGEKLAPYFEKAVRQKPCRHSLANESRAPLSEIGG